MRIGQVILLAGVLCAGGCVNYYKVTDPSTGKTYYTTQLTQRTSGATTLTDARSGDEVTIQNSVVAKINKDQFQAGKYAEPATPMPAK